MEWIKDYWFVALLVLIAAMVIFGHRTKGSDHSHQHASGSDEKTRKGGGICCH